MISHVKEQEGPIADIFFHQGADEMTIHCFCSRAFVRYKPLITIFTSIIYLFRLNADVQLLSVLHFVSTSKCTPDHHSLICCSITI